MTTQSGVKTTETADCDFPSSRLHPLHHVERRQPRQGDRRWPAVVVFLRPQHSSSEHQQHCHSTRPHPHPPTHPPASTIATTTTTGAAPAVWVDLPHCRGWRGKKGSTASLLFSFAVGEHGVCVCGYRCVLMIC